MRLLEAEHAPGLSQRMKAVVGEGQYTHRTSRLDVLQVDRCVDLGRNDVSNDYSAIWRLGYLTHWMADRSQHDS